MASYFNDIELKELPYLVHGYAKAALQLGTKGLRLGQKGGHALPKLPNTRFILKYYTLNPKEVAEYTENTQLANRDVLPITYLYSVAFPIVIKLLTETDFPFPPVGLVHLYNKINHYQPVATDATVDLYVHAENLREHRSGLLVDVITEVYSQGVLVWSQISTMLRKQKTSLSNSPRPVKEEVENPPPTSTEVISVSSSTIRQYASISGDRNPIHLSSWAAKAFGFPQMIAHGSWTMSRILSSTENDIPVVCSFEVNFGKPFLVPGKADLLIYHQTDEKIWDYTLVNTEKNKVHLTAKISPLIKD